MQEHQIADTSNLHPWIAVDDGTTYRWDPEPPLPDVYEQIRCLSEQAAKTEELLCEQQRIVSQLQVAISEITQKLSSRQRSRLGEILLWEGQR